MQKHPTCIVFTLCNYVDKHIKLTHSLIKATIRTIWLEHKSMTGTDTFNIRVKIHRCQKNFQNKNEDYKSFKNVINDSMLLSGIDDAAMLDDNEAYQLAYSICQEVLESSNNDEDAIFSFREYLDLICAREKKGYHMKYYPTLMLQKRSYLEFCG